MSNQTKLNVCEETYSELVRRETQELLEAVYGSRRKPVHVDPAELDNAVVLQQLFA